MASTINKQQALTHVLSALKKTYDPPPPRELPVLEQLIYGTLREGATCDQADRAFITLNKQFFDWNEARVSTSQEVAEALKGLPDAAAKAERVVNILQEVFERFFSFQLDEIDKKGLKHAAKKLREMKDVTDFAVAWVLQRSLGGHALPLDSPTLRVLKRNGLIEDEAESLESLRATLEHYVPKAKGPAFTDAISTLALEMCWEDDPHCSQCPLRSECATGQMRKSTESRSPRKPR